MARSACKFWHKHCPPMGKWRLKAPVLVRARRRDVESPTARIDEGVAASNLCEHLLQLCAIGDINAKQFCLACWWAVQSGVKNVDLSRYAFPPGRQTGTYSRSLKNKLPSQLYARELHVIDMPALMANRRTTKRVACSPVFDVMNQEHVTLTREGHDLCTPTETEWTPNFFSHPMYDIPGDARPVFPFAIYLDAIKFTRSVGVARADSVIGVTTYNLTTNRRHLLYVVSKREQCRCGCGGHCSMYAILSHLQWGIEACTRGLIPDRRWDGSEWPIDSALRELAGQPMSARFILTQIKGDWLEFAQNLSLPSWATYHQPCFVCGCDRTTMHDYNRITLDHHCWGDKHLSYEEACRACEVEVGEHRELRINVGVGRVICNQLSITEVGTVCVVQQMTRPSSKPILGQ